MASLAGWNIIAAISSTNEANTRPSTESTHGSVATTPPRTNMVMTITCLRSSRSISAPTGAEKKRPGTIRAAMTRPIDVPVCPDASPSRLARARMAKNPSQSPVEAATWAIHRRKKAGDPKTRVRKSVASSSAGPTPVAARPLDRRARSFATRADGSSTVCSPVWSGSFM